MFVIFDNIFLIGNPEYTANEYTVYTGFNGNVRSV